MSGTELRVARRARAMVAAVALLLATAGVAHAQATPAASGARVRVVDARGRVSLEGRVSRVTRDSLYLRTEHGVVALDRATLPGLQVSAGRRGLVVNMLVGAAALGVAGAIYGDSHPLRSHADECLTPGSCIERAADRHGASFVYGVGGASFVYGVGGAAVGALLGAVVTPVRWVAGELVERR